MQISGSGGGGGGGGGDLPWWIGLTIECCAGMHGEHLLQCCMGTSQEGAVVLGRLHRIKDYITSPQKHTRCYKSV